MVNMRGLNDLYDWYQLARKKDLGETKIAWLQYFEDKSSGSSQNDNPHLVRKEQQDCIEDKVVEESSWSTSQFEALDKDLKKENSSDSKKKEAVSPLLSDTPQCKRNLPYSNFCDVSFVSPPPLTTCDGGTSEKSVSSSTYSPTTPMLDIFSPRSGNGNRTEDIITSLGVSLNESSVTWTSDLATPCSHPSSKGQKLVNTPSTLEHRTLYPSHGLRQKVLARSLFSPLTTGSQPSDNEWSPNLGIIKCHSPVRAFSVKGRYNKENLQDANLQRCQVDGTQEFLFIDQEKREYNLDVNASSNDQKTSDVTAQNSCKDYSKCKSSTPLAKPPPVIKGVLEPEESTNTSLSNTTEKAGLFPKIMEDNDLSDIVDCSQKNIENPFDIICSPVKKKSKSSRESYGENLTKSRCTVGNKKSNSSASESTISVDVKRSGQLVLECNTKSTEDSFQSCSQKYDGTRKGSYQDADLKEESLGIMSDDRISNLNCTITNENEVKINAENIVCEESGVHVTSLSGREHLHSGKITDRHLQENCNLVTDADKVALPVPDRSKNLRNKCSLFSKRRSSGFLYPTKSVEAYEELGITFKKNITSEQSHVYEDNVDAIAGIFQVDITEYKDNVSTCSGGKIKVPDDVQLRNGGHCNSASDLDSNSDKLPKHMDSIKSCSDIGDTNDGVSTNEVKREGNSLVFNTRSKDAESSEVFEPLQGVTLLSSVEEEKCNTVSQFWNDSLNEADIAELEQKLNLQTKDFCGDEAMYLGNPNEADVQNEKLALPVLHSGEKKPYFDMLNTEEEVTESNDFREVALKPSRFQGFSTASGSVIKVQESSIKKVQSLWEENSSTDDIPVHPKSVRSTDSAYSKNFEPLHHLASASGSKINICEEFSELQSKSNGKIFDGGKGSATGQNETLNNKIKVSDTGSAGFSSHDPLNENPVNFKGFQGFTTASGSQIRVEEESLMNQAKKFQELFDKDEFTCGAKVHSADNNQNSNAKFHTAVNNQNSNAKVDSTVSNQNSNAKVDSTVNSQNSNIIKNDVCAKSVCLKTEFSCHGFTTAGGSKIQLSEESLSLQAKKFQDLFGNDEVVSMDKDVEFNKASTVVKERNTVDFISHGSGDEKSTSFQGFSTASGSKIRINKESLCKQLNMFQELFDKDEVGLAVEEEDGLITNEEKNKTNSVYHGGAENHDSTSKLSKNCKGFTTAAGSKIRVSEESLVAQSKKFQELFGNDEYNSLEQDVAFNNKIKTSAGGENPTGKSQFSENKRSFQGFTTASGSKVRVSEESLLKSRKLLELDKDNSGFLPQDSENIDGDSIRKEDFGPLKHCSTSEFPEKFQGFSTAAGSKIKLSKKSLALHAKKFQELLGNGDSSSTEKDVTSDTIIRTPIEYKNHADVKYCSADKESFHGFTTALGSKVKVSDESLLKSRKVLELDKDEEELSASGSGNINGEASNILQNENFLLVENNSTLAFSEQQGFNTAAGSRIRISKENLVLHLEKFQEFLDSDRDSREQGYNNDSVIDIVKSRDHTGFVDGSPACRISKELNGNISASIVSSCEGSDDNKKHGTCQRISDTVSSSKNLSTFHGFTTASGSKIIPSEESLLVQSKKFLAFLDNEDDYNRKGENTGGNVKNDLNVGDTKHTSPHPKNKQPLQGFTSASGSKIHVSEEKLSEYSKKFQELFENDVDGTSWKEKIGSHRNYKDIKENIESTTNLNQISHSGQATSKSSVVDKLRNGNTSCGTFSELAVEEKMQVKVAPVGESLQVKDSSSTEGYQTGSVNSLEGLANTVELINCNGNLTRQMKNMEQDVSCENKKSIEKALSDSEMKHLDMNLEYKNHDSDNDERSTSPIIGSQSVHVERQRKLRRYDKKRKRSLEASKVVSDEEGLGNLGNVNMKEVQPSHISCLTVNKYEGKDINSEEEYRPQFDGCEHRDQLKCHSQDTIKGRHLYDRSILKRKSLPAYENKRSELRKRIQSVEEKSATSDTQEISIITEAFLQDDSWESEDTSRKKRKAQEEKHDGNPAKILKCLDVRHPLELDLNNHADIETLLRERELLCIKQERKIQEKREHSVHPVQGVLHKQRSDSNHPRLSMKSFGTPVVFKSSSVEALGITASNASVYRFPLMDKRIASINCGEGCHIIPGPDNCIGSAETERGFLAMPGVSPRLVPSGWVSNHYKWIVWKLAAIERCLTKKKFLTLENLVARLKYRYDREIDRAERPIIRKIMEGDDIPQKTIVLCIADIRNDQMKDKSASHPSVSPLKSSGVPFLTLTDGWYSIDAIVDNAMLQLHNRGKISVGTKLLIHGAELAGHFSPCHPLEAPPGLGLRLHTNMVRRARWWSRLGLVSQPLCLPVQLGSILSDGGVAGCITVVLSRVYPLIYFERSNKNSFFRGEKAHLRLVKENQQFKEITLHQIVAEVEKEFAKEEGSLNQKNQNRVSITGKEVSDLRRGKEIAQFLENTVDESNVEGLLTASQIELARSWHQEQAEMKRHKINAEVHRRLNTKQKLYEAVPVLKIRVMDTNGSCAILSVWRPSEELQQTLLEGKIFRIFYVVAAGYRRDCLQLTATRQTRWEDIGTETDHSFPDCCRHATPLCLTLSETLQPAWNEVDVVGVVFRIGQMDQGSQLVHIVDHHINILALRFWGGLKECGVEDIVSCESIVSVSNGSWRGYSGGRCACVHVTELSVVSISPRHSHLVEAFEHLKKNIEDVKALTSKADMKLDGYTDECSFYSADSAVTSNCLQTEESINGNVHSPAATNIHQTAGSASVGTPDINRRAERSREIRSKLKSLAQYGMPSPLTGVTYNNPSPKTWKPFRVPFKNSNLK
ncbi:breast cancer type 2 susceptibility protein-like isoform X2 [Macrobrachium rosenbergii]|uniref:breast cancer type 2 susceptibility protein-like isoform X2 n=1 Tax=Macrobrachium rosenbergii TaxID=79674 RepID=UPI0034D4A96C